MSTGNGQLGQEAIRRLYDPTESGFEVVRDYIDAESLSVMTNAIAARQHLFETKREKYIENNQLVSLLYRGPFDPQSNNPLTGTPFQYLYSHWLMLRWEVDYHRLDRFVDGSSIEIKVISYPVSELGVDYHRDLTSNVNLITFFNIEGEADVCIIPTKEDTSNPKKYRMKPGDVSIMRAPCVKGEPDIRPIHGVIEVPMPRIVVAIREIDEELEKQTNANNWRGF